MNQIVPASQAAARAPSGLTTLSAALKSVHELLLSGKRGERAKALEPADLPALRDYVAEVERSIQPAGDDAINAYVTRLRSHYPPGAELDDELEGWNWIDWYQDLADLPIDVLAEACRLWRNSKERWAPTPGQLRGMVDVDMHLRTRRWRVDIAREATAELEQRECVAIRVNAEE